jgi:FMN phosphatase YigB (HAD superfamily)
LTVGQRLLELGVISSKPSDFRRARIRAEVDAGETSHSGGPRHLEIYKLLGKTMGWSEAQTRLALGVEIDVENSLLSLAPKAAKMVADERERGNRIVFLSDMYWSRKHLQALLTSRGVALEGEKVFVSCEEGLGKAAGGLFRCAIKNLGVKKSEFKHVGNNITADIRGAKRAGVAAIYLGDGNLTDAERVILGNENCLWEQSLSGAARLCRLRWSYGRNSAHELGLTNVVVSVVMPVLLAFAIWVVRRARALSIERLLFVSRDGWLLKRCVEKAICILGVNLECKYIYGSRQAWHGAGLDPHRLDEQTWLTESRDGISFARLISRIGLNPESCDTYSSELGLASNAESILSKSEISTIGRRIANLSPEGSNLRRDLECRRQSVVSYLRQEGVFEGKSTAIVDVGWVGRLQDSLNRLITQEGGSKVRGLFFGLARDDSAREGKLRDAFMFDNRTPSSSTRIPQGLLAVVESFCTQRHGTTVSYKKNHLGKWEPVFRADQENVVISWGIDHVHQVAIGYLEDFPLQCGVEEVSESQLMKSAQRVLFRFCTEPYLYEARTWGGYPFEHEQSGGGCLQLAQEYPSGTEGLRRAVNARTAVDLGGYWVSGARKLTPVPKRIAFDVVRKATEIVRQYIK